MDVLVFIEQPDSDPAENRRAIAAARQTIGARLHVLATADTAALPTARVLKDPRDLDAARAVMTDQERLFAEAWLTRQTDKDRAGASLPWDTPGFEAP